MAEKVDAAYKAGCRRFDGRSTRFLERLSYGGRMELTGNMPTGKNCLSYLQLVEKRYQCLIRMALKPAFTRQRILFQLTLVFKARVACNSAPLMVKFLILFRFSLIKFVEFGYGYVICHSIFNLFTISLNKNTY